MFEALAFTAGLALAATATPAAEAAASDRALLEATDPFARAASSSRARLRVTGSGGRATALEIWRSGENALVRFLDPKESGKYLLRARDGTFFISPGARQPVRLPPTHRLAGAVAIEELLAVPLSATHEIAAVQRRDTASGVVEFDLKARNAAATYPRMRWVVSERERLPLRADFQFADGRVARVLEWKEWRDKGQLTPMTIVIKDVLRGGSPATVEILEFEARDVPAELFSLTDPSARAALQDPR